MGFLSQKKTKSGKAVWCVHNQATGRVIRARGRLRCYFGKATAAKVLAKLDCHYTGRRCRSVPKGYTIPPAVRERVELD